MITTTPTDTNEGDAAIAAAATAAIATASRSLGAPRDPAKQFKSHVSYYTNFTKYVDAQRAQGKLPIKVAEEPELVGLPVEDLEVVQVCLLDQLVEEAIHTVFQGIGLLERECWLQA